jgi:hypothetical protein
VYVGSSVVGCVHLQNNGFLEDLFNDGLEKIASKMARCQVCMSGAI